MDKKTYFRENNKDGRKSREKWLMKNQPELYQKIIKHCEDNNIEIVSTKFAEKIWYYINDVNDTKLCHCGNNVKFDDLGNGFRKNCSLKCAGTSKERAEKIKRTNLERYGTEYPQQSDEVMDKIKKTNLERYGAEYAISSDVVREKSKNTLMKNYGVEHPLQSKEIREKALDTTEDRHGVRHILQSEEYREKHKQTNLERYGAEHYKQSVESTKRRLAEIMIKIPEYKLIKIEDSDVIIECSEGHVFEIDSLFLNKRIYKKNNPCLICNPYRSYSKSENEVVDFIKNSDTHVITNSRQIIAPLELDIYLPEHKIAIEYDGLYWHSDECVSDNYHLNKTKKCENNDIQLIHIFEDEWLFKEEIVKSRLLNLINKTPNKVYARKCSIEKVSTQDSRAFLNKNHIQGYVNANIIYGLYHNGELVSIMTFGKRRKNLGAKHVEGEYELLRFCNKLNTNVIGGASKLFNRFIRNNEYDKIISYADRRWSQGDLYHKLGFDDVGTSSPGYFYVKGYNRENRFKYRKSELVKEGFDENLTEREIMKQRGYHRIYDCGTYKFEYKNKQK